MIVLVKMPRGGEKKKKKKSLVLHPSIKFGTMAKSQSEQVDSLLQGLETRLFTLTFTNTVTSNNCEC